MDQNNQKRRALGRGLEELFNNEVLDYSSVEEKIISETKNEEIQNISLDELRSNPYQPRKNFDEEALQELANSIKEHGVFQPIIVKKSIKGYEIIAGERRVKASKLAGLTEIPAIVRDFNDTQMMEIALLENLQREDLNAIEEASAYKKLQETLALTQEELANRLGKSRSHITNMIGLLSLPQSIQDYIIQDKISMGHARVLSKLEDENQQETLAQKVINEGLSVRELEDLTQSTEEFSRKRQIIKKPIDNEYIYVQEELCERLGTKVKVKKNKIEISFTNTNDLNRILEIMNVDVFGITFDLKLVILPLIYIVIGIIIFEIIKKFIIKATDRRKNLKATQRQRIQTFRTLIINIIKYVIVILVILSIISVYGINIKSILAGLGIGTAIIGLAFKDLATDLIAGFSIIIEGEYEIGDTIEIDGFMGEVVFIGLRTTRIRNFKGATKIIANHYMDNIINYSDNNSLAVLDISVAYETDEKLVEETFEKLFKRLNGNVPFATKDLELWGVNNLDNSAVVYRVVVETEPMKQFVVERYLRKEIKKEFDLAKIKIPYQQIEVHNGK